MPDIPIRFTKGISRLKGAPLDSIYDIQNAKLTPIDEIVAFKHGTFKTDQFIPRSKPWRKYAGRWFDGDYMDDSAVYRNRAYFSKVIDEGGGLFSGWTFQLTEDSDDLNNIYHYRQSRRLTNPFFILGYNYVSAITTGFRTNRSIQTFRGISYAGGTNGWDANDTGIQGVTVGRAVDYIFVPVDRFGQPGAWAYVTVYVDSDPSSFGTVTGSDIVTRVPRFTFERLIYDIDDERTYDKVFVYRTIEYDIDGETTEQGTSAAESEPFLGGYYFEGVANGATYDSKAYWPFSILDETSAIADQLGPVIDRSRNHWRGVINDEFTSSNVGAKAIYNDGGTMIYGNVATPTKQPYPSMFVERVESTISATFSTGPNTIARGSGSWITDGIEVGDIVYVQGAANDANNSKFTVTAVTATDLTVTETPTAEGPTADVKVYTGPKVGLSYRYTKTDGKLARNSKDTQDGLVFTSGDPELLYEAEKMVVGWDGEEGLDVWVEFTGNLTNIDAGNDQITLEGDWEEFFGATRQDYPASIRIDGTASNDGIVTIGGSDNGSGAVAAVLSSTGGELTLDASAGTMTRTIGSWITDGYTVGQQFTLADSSLNTKQYTVTGTVTALTIEVVENIPADTVMSYFIIIPVESSVSGNNTTVTVNEDITVTEAATGTFTFYVLWETLKPDQNGRYVSEKQNAGQRYTFNSQSEDFDILTASDYQDPVPLGEIPTGQDTIRNESIAYLSETNAPWSVTYDSFIVPDSAEIRAIVPSRIEEIEQLTSYSFYVLTDTAVYVGSRSGRDVALVGVESSMGVALGGDNQPLVTPVKSGIVFYGTDNNLYYVTGRQVSKLSYEVTGNREDPLWDGVTDIGYDADEDWLYLVTSDNTAADSDAYIYDFNTQRWIGAYDVFIPGAEEYRAEIRIEDVTEPTDTAGHQIGSTITFNDTYTFKQSDFLVTVDTVQTTGLVLDIYHDVISPPSSTLIATVDQDYSLFNFHENDWAVSAGAILSGDYDVEQGDQLRVVINSVVSLEDAAIKLRIKGLQENGLVPSNLQLKRIGFDPETYNPGFGYESVGGGLLNMYEEMDDTGKVIEDAEIETQEFSTALVQELRSIRFDYDGVLYTSTADTTAGSNQLTNLDTNDIFNTGRDSLATILIEDGGHNVSGTDVDLVTFIDTISGSVATLVDDVANTNTGIDISWRNSGNLLITLISNNFRDRTIGTIRVRPNKPIFPHSTKNHRMRLKFEDFETLREILIFTDNKLESD